MGALEAPSALAVTRRAPCSRVRSVLGAMT
jgi:hypothetical protein